MTFRIRLRVMRRRVLGEPFEIEPVPPGMPVQTVSANDPALDQGLEPLPDGAHFYSKRLFQRVHTRTDFGAVVVRERGQRRGQESIARLNLRFLHGSDHSQGHTESRGVFVGRQAVHPASAASSRTAARIDTLANRRTTIARSSAVIRSIAGVD